MLEIGGVIDARRQHHHLGLLHAGGRQRAQHVEQLRRIVIDRQDTGGLEHLGEHAFYDLAVLEHVRHPGGDAQIVLQHVHRAVGAAHQVRAADVRPDALRRVNADALRAKVGRIGQVSAREHVIAHDALLVVDVVDEQIERLRALLQPGFDAPPLVERDHARNDVERPGAIDRSALLVIDRKGDPHAANGCVGGLLARRELFGSERREKFDQCAGCGPRCTTGPDQLIEARRRRILFPGNPHAICEAPSDRLAATVAGRG